ncbi:DedA family protein [Halobacillus rhizosphaerae]|uniref:DedA family protein n=1 Tax=Halobacillus rhizosphaerae TaxID=3064889 RepID=UPI00398AE817
MSLDFVTQQIQVFGYWIIIIVLICGIIGVPAPEETFMVFLGMLAAKGHLNFGLSLLSVTTGAFIGMMLAYFIGRKAGKSFIERYGKYVKLTEQRWEKAAGDFRESGKWLVFTAFFFPGFRQLSPYIAGTSGLSLLPFIVLSAAGSFTWGLVFTAGGYFLGDHLPLSYLPWAGGLALLAFILISIKKYKSN